MRSGALLSSPSSIQKVHSGSGRRKVWRDHPDVFIPKDALDPFAVQKAAANIPAEVCARFENAEKLSDEDRNMIIEIARQALTAFQPKPESKLALESKAKAEHAGESEPDAPTMPTAEATDKS